MKRPQPRPAWRVPTWFQALVLAAAIAAPWDAGEAQLFRRGPVAACRDDVLRLCPGVRPGGGRLIVCLNSQAEQLSQGCFQALAERGLATAAALRLCRPDFERLCPGVVPGGGKALACLLDNAAGMSPGCREALDAHGLGADGEPEPPPLRRDGKPPFPPASSPAHDPPRPPRP